DRRAGAGGGSRHRDDGDHHHGDRSGHALRRRQSQNGRDGRRRPRRGGGLTAGIQIERVTKRFGATTAVRDLSLHVPERESVTLLGPSGCGKTTLLRMLAGFVAPDAGVIRVGGSTLSTPTATVPPERRGMGMVFQNYAVWPHKTVAQNVGFGLAVRKVSR